MDGKTEQKDQAIANRSEPWEKSNHPLFLHHSDQPGAILVAQTLVEDNYTTWAQAMEMALTIKNKKGFIDGTISKPSGNPVEEIQWQRCNTLVKMWLLGSMSKEISSSVIHCKDAKGMWLELKERFSHTNTVLLFQLESAIHDCKKGSDSATTYFNKLKGLWDERDALCGFPSCTCGLAVEAKAYMENQKTMQFLMGLDEDFAQTRSYIIGLNPLPALNKAYAMVLRQEKSNRPTTPPEAAAFAFQRGNRDEHKRDGTTKYCDKCKMTNHDTKNCRSHMKCSYCNGKGHTMDYCRRKKKSIRRRQFEGKLR